MFRIGATFEMRTTLQDLFIQSWADNAQQGFYIKTKYVGREQDNRETKRERESVRDRALLEMRITSAIK
jgi:hypothetical protein